MRAEGDTETTVYAEEGFSLRVEENGIDRTGGRAGSAAITQFFLDHYPAILARHQGAGRTDVGARRGRTGQTMNGCESGG